MYTFILDWKGGTYLQQAKGSTVYEAMWLWARDFDPAGVSDLEPPFARELNTELDDENPTQITGLVNTWCISVVVQDALALIHVVRTEDAARG